MKIDILGVKIDNLDFLGAIQEVNRLLSHSKTCQQITTPNPEFVMAAQKDKEFKKIINESALAIPDGTGLIYAAKFLGKNLPEKITGVDFTWELCKLAAQKGYPVYFLGAAPGVARKAARRIKLIHPDLKIAGTYSGSPDEKGLVERLNACEPLILLVAYGAPKQEKFIYKNLKKLNCRIAIGVGGTFDYIASVVPRAPEWMRRLGLEWFYRLARQPSRIPRIFTAVVIFPLAVFVEKIKERNR